jgi:hypothetical protein
MIYACLRFIEEWAHPLTVVNFTLIGLSSGLVLACALAALAGEARFVQVFGPWALAATLAAWLARGSALRRNARLRHKSTLQSATGIRTQQLVQKSMGMSAGSFNTREFFHGASLAVLKNMKLGFLLLAFALPALLALWAASPARPRGHGCSRWRCRRRGCWPSAGSSSRRRSIRRTCTTRWCPDVECRLKPTRSTRQRPSGTAASALFFKTPGGAGGEIGSAEAMRVRRRDGRRRRREGRLEVGNAGEVAGDAARRHAHLRSTTALMWVATATSTPSWLKHSTRAVMRPLSGSTVSMV